MAKEALEQGLAMAKEAMAKEVLVKGLVLEAKAQARTCKSL